MYKKYLIVASKKDKAGVNITTALSQYRENPLKSALRDSVGFDFYLVEKDILHEENLDLEKINKYDFVIFASKHKSDKEEKTFSIHAPGNFREAKYGGQQGKVCKSSGLFQKALFEKLNEKTKEAELDDKYSVTMEATHHGPLIDKPCVFIEIGSTETEWDDRRAAFVIAKTIKETIDSFEENPYREVVVGVGGPHYCPNFNKLQLNSNLAFSHVLASYVLPLTEEMINEAVAKTVEEVDWVILDWKGLRGEGERKRILEILDRLYLPWKKLSDLK